LGQKFLIGAEKPPEIKTMTWAGDEEEKATSIVIAKTNVCGERRDLFI
jgi:hypothetical protein